MLCRMTLKVKSMSEYTNFVGVMPVREGIYMYSSHTVQWALKEKTTFLFSRS